MLANPSDAPRHRDKSLICVPMKSKGVEVVRKLDKIGMRWVRCLNTSPTNHHPLRQMQLQRWEGQGYVRFGNIIEGADL